MSLTKADSYMKKSIENILNNGYKDKNPRPKYDDGTPAYTLSVNHVVHQYNISEGEFPITILRPIYIKKAIGEVLWIYQDESNDLDVLKNKYNVTWWDSWDIGNRTIGCCYGETVRKHNLMRNLLEDIKNDPYGRRHIINLWQEDDFKNQHGLKPCCYQTQYNVRDDKYLDMVLYQRSSDWLTAGNINQMQYVALMMMVARHCGYEPGIFTHFIANQQIYDKHIEQAKEMLNRYKNKQKETVDRYSHNYHSKNTKEELEYYENLKEEHEPKLILNPEKTDFYSFTIDDFTLKNYEPIKPQLTFELGI